MSDNRSADDDVPPGHDPYSALRVSDFRWFVSGNVISLVGMQMQFAACWWEIGVRTGSALAAGHGRVGAGDPGRVAGAVAGHVADRVNRKYIVMIASCVIAGGAVGLLLMTLVLDERLSLIGMYTLLCVTASRAPFNSREVVVEPQLVPRDRFTTPVTWSATAFQMASSSGRPRAAR